MNEKDTIRLVNKLKKMIKLNQLVEMQKLNQIQFLDYEHYADLFIEACANDSTAIVKYLYELRELGEFALHDGFSCCLDTGNFNTIHTLICDLQIHKNSDVNEELKRHLNKLKKWNKDFYDKVIPLFNFTELNEALSDTNKKKQRIKI